MSDCNEVSTGKSARGMGCRPITPQTAVNDFKSGAGDLGLCLLRPGETREFEAGNVWKCRTDRLGHGVAKLRSAYSDEPGGEFG